MTSLTSLVKGLPSPVFQDKSKFMFSLEQAFCPEDCLLQQELVVFPIQIWLSRGTI